MKIIITFLRLYTEKMIYICYSIPGNREDIFICIVYDISLSNQSVSISLFFWLPAVFCIRIHRNCNISKYHILNSLTSLHSTPPQSQNNCDAHFKLKFSVVFRIWNIQICYLSLCIIIIMIIKRWWWYDDECMNEYLQII